MKEGLIKNTYSVIVKEIQTTATIAYVVAVGVGMLFSYQKYAEFGINIFEYADVFDFLIAPFSDFKILLFAVGSTFIVFVIITLDFYWQKKSPNFYSKSNFGLDKKSWFETFRFITFGVLSMVYLYIAADYYGAISSNQIKNQSAISVRFEDNETITGNVIGKTKEVLFLLTNDKVKVIPITALVKDYDIK